MKRTLFLISLTLSNTVFANESCSFTWDLKSSGIFVGKTIDVITKDNGLSEVKSSSTPSTIAEIFNVKKVIRTVVFKSNKLISRIEEAQGKNNKIIAWYKHTDNTWEQSIDGEPKDKANVDSNYTALDSTSLPYLLYLNILPDKSDNYDIIVINKSSPYHAKVFIEDVNEPIKKYRILFKTSKSTGIVYLDSAKKPLEMFFDDSKFSFSGIMKTNTCN
jgi:hypothetical protein